MLALWLALFGFVVAPLIHTFTHTHGHGHRHAGAPASHAGSSLEHFTLATDDAPPLETGLVVRLAVRAEPTAIAPSPRFQERRSTEQAQGPPARG